ncbi:MAG: hypothetical protein HZC55_22885 [Verrucomicrobia bacterium]|nr:hypothetical protein [Verrucomicrobiota bacterium]
MPEHPSARLVAIAIASAGLSALFGLSQSSPVFGVAAGMAFATLLSILVLPEKYVVYPVFVVIVNMLDHTTTTEVAMYGGVGLRASLWQLAAFGVSPAMIVFSVLLVRGLFSMTQGAMGRIRWLVLYFLVLMPVVSMAYGFLLHERPMRIFGDAKVPLFFIVGYLIFSSYYRRYPQQLLSTCQVLLAMVAGHFALDYFYLLTQRFVDDTSGFGNVSLDSGKGFVCVLIFAAIAQIYRRRNILFNLVIILLSLHLLVSYQTRWLLVTLLAGAVLTMIYTGLRALPSVLTTAVFLMVAIPVVVRWSPTAWEVMSLRFRLSEGTVDLSTAGLEALDACRVASIYNALGTLSEKYAFLTGVGYGGWYDDRFYAFPPLTLHAFDLESLNAGQFYRVHDFTIHFLFKFGVLGILLYAGVFVRPLIKLWRPRRALLEKSAFGTVVIVLVGTTPMIMTAMFWTGKGLLASALLAVLASRLWPQGGNSRDSSHLPGIPLPAPPK